MDDIYPLDFELWCTVTFNNQEHEIVGDLWLSVGVLWFVLLLGTAFLLSEDAGLLTPKEIFSMQIERK